VSTAAHVDVWSAPRLRHMDILVSAWSAARANHVAPSVAALSQTRKFVHTIHRICQSCKIHN
jgi:hypothetical protein